MHVAQLKGQNFRCFSAFNLQLNSGLNFIVGDNAAGKTSLLEALYFLGNGKTFRRSYNHALVRHEQSSFLLTGQVHGQQAVAQHIGVQFQQGQLDYRIDGRKDTSRYDLVSLLPVQLVTPDLHQLLEQGPSFRRQFLDWGVFHVKHAFFTAWRHYRRALKQRNKALRMRAPTSMVTAWDQDLVRYAGIIDDCRQDYIQQLTQALPETMQRILGEDQPSIGYKTGWYEGCTLEQSLAESLERDRKAGYTTQGPHRADIVFKVGTTKARAHISRGQQKAFIVALLLTQAALVKTATGKSPVLLIDDIAAELGQRFLHSVLDEIKTTGCQAVLSFLNDSSIRDMADEANLFHVEHGSVSLLNAPA